MRKIIGITMGDPCGVGPEVILKALAARGIKRLASFIVIGSEQVLRQTAANLRLRPAFRFFTSSKGCRAGPGEICVLDLGNFSSREMDFKGPSPQSGKASLEYIFEAVDMALREELDAIVTAPISKEALRMAGSSYAGHTEILKERTETKEVAMMMVGGGLRMSFVTTHVPLSSVPGMLTADRVLSTISLTEEGLRNLFHVKAPRLVLCGLNPHAGEGGYVGNEEEKILAPAVRLARAKGINCAGPIAADMVFYKVLNKEFDAAVALYHDQGTIALKLLAFEKGVNLTLGLPIIRTSPTHGTAYDISGKGIASPGSMIGAIKLATALIGTAALNKK